MYNNLYTYDDELVESIHRHVMQEPDDENAVQG